VPSLRLKMADEPLTLAALAKFLDPKLARIDERFNLIDARFDDVFGHFDAIYQRFDRLETEYLQTLEARLED
jgi:hypothetical protein